MAAEKKPTKNEAIKRESRGLRGTLAEEVANPELSHVSDASKELLKFHGSYQQFDRDTQTERKKQGLDKEWQYMVRVKMPGGRMTAEQYLALDKLADEYCNGTLRITTRQTFQFHGILKEHLRDEIAGINRTLLSTLATCGDVVRNVITCPAPIRDKIHDRLWEDCLAVARHMTPVTDGYVDIWLDGEKIETPIDGPQAATGGEEPIYGETYLPRKFKIAIGQPEDNCMDALCNDLAILALFDEEQNLKGYNFALGGGLGMTHNKPQTYPRLASPVAFVRPEDLIPAAEAVVKLQRDHGDRTNRKHARLKYLVEEKGYDWTHQTLEQYFGRELDAPVDMPAFHIEDHMGWHEQGDGKWFLGVPVPSGRILDREGMTLRTAIRELLETCKLSVRLTNDQNLILCDIEAGEKQMVEQVLQKHGVTLRPELTELARYFLACVSYPTCGLALAEAERVQTDMVKDIERLLQKFDLLDVPLSVRVTGCPNGCARPYAGDIGVVGRMPGHYALYIGGDFEGTRLNSKILDRVPYEHLAEVLEPMFSLYAQKHVEDEGFGDFCERYGVEKVKQTVVDALGSTYKWAA